MIELTPKQRRELRAKAHRLHPVVIVGQHGLTPAVMHEIDVALEAHGLIKVRVLSEDRSAREAMLVEIVGALDAAPVQHLGKLLIVWRPLEEAAKPVKRVARKPVKAKRAAAKSPPREPRASTPIGRRFRGQPIAPPGDELPSGTRRRSPAPSGLRPPRGKSAPNARRRRRAA